MIYTLPATRDPHKESPHEQFSAFKRWLFRVLGRPLIAQPPKAKVFEIKNPRLEIARRRRERLQRKARES